MASSASNSKPCRRARRVVHLTVKTSDTSFAHRATVIVTAALLDACARSRREVDLSEEHAVGLAPNLREINFRCRRRNKPETVPCALLRCYRHVNGRRRLEEVAGELIDRVAESDNAPCDAAPSKVEGLDDCAHNVS